MSRTTRPRLLRATASAVAITAACFTTVACGSDVVEDGVEQEIQEGVEEGEQEGGEEGGEEGGGD
jgi:hypothetical protein